MPGCGCGGGTIPRSRDGVNAAGRTREDEGLSKGVFYHLSARFDRRVRGRARRAHVPIDGIIHRFHPRPRNGGSVVRCHGVTVSLVVRSFATRRVRAMSDGTNRSHPSRWIACFVSFRFVLSPASRARSRRGRSIGRDRRPRGVDTHHGGRGWADVLEPGIRTRGIGMTVHDSRMCILPKL